MTTEAYASPSPGWGRANSYLSFKESQAPVTEKGLVDRLNILDVLARYGWSYDERNVPASENCFTEEAVWEGSVGGNITIGPLAGRTAISGWLQGHMVAQRDQRRHNILNEVFVSQTDTTAEVIAYLLLTSSEDSATRTVTSGFYRVHFVKSQAGAWQIKYMFAGFDNPF